MTITFKPIIRNRNLVLNPSHNRLLAAQKGRCFYCGKFMTSWTKDHLFPRSHGFTLAGNLVFSCESCNNRKADRIPSPHEIIRALTLWRSCLSKAKKHRAGIIRSIGGKPRFKMCMSAQDIYDWTM